MKRFIFSSTASTGNFTGSQTTFSLGTLCQSNSPPVSPRPIHPHFLIQFNDCTAITTPTASYSAAALLPNVKLSHCIPLPSAAPVDAGGARASSVGAPQKSKYVSQWSDGLGLYSLPLSVNQKKELALPAFTPPLFRLPFQTICRASVLVLDFVYITLLDYP